MQRLSIGDPAGRLIIAVAAFAAFASSYGCTERGTPEVVDAPGAHDVAVADAPLPEAGAPTHLDVVPLAAPSGAGRASDPRQADLVAALWNAAEEDGEPFGAIAAAAACEECLESLRSVLDDDREPASRRVLAARVLLASSRSDAAAEVLAAIEQLDLEHSAELRAQLIGVLADVQNTAAASSLRDALASGERGDRPVDGTDIGPEERAAIIAGLQRTLGAGVANELLSSLPDAADRAAVRGAVAALGDPALTTEVVLAAHADGDPTETSRLLDTMLGTDEPQVLDGLLLLAGGEALSWPEASDLAQAWVERVVTEGGAPPHDVIVDHLSRFDASPEQRRFAVQALAGERDQEQARAALAKALAYETDPSVVETIELAIENFDAGGE